MPYYIVIQVITECNRHDAETVTIGGIYTTYEKSKARACCMWHDDDFEVKSDNPDLGYFYSEYKGESVRREIVTKKIDSLDKAIRYVI